MSVVRQQQQHYCPIQATSTSDADPSFQLVSECVPRCRIYSEAEVHGSESVSAVRGSTCGRVPDFRIFGSCGTENERVRVREYSA